MKINLIKKYAGLGLAALTLGSTGVALAQTADLTVNTFDSSASGTGQEWGSGSVAWDGGNGNPPGAFEMTVDFSSSSDTPCTAYICLAGGNPWYQPQLVDLTQYKSIDFDIMYDPSSDITIPEFNDLSTWPTTLTNSTGAPVFQSWAPAGYLGGSIGGLEVNVCSPANQMGPVIMNTNIPIAAAGKWVHVSIPVNATEAGISSINGIVFHKWINQNWGILNDAVARIWIDNVVFKGTAGPPPPPKISLPKPAAQGLNVFATTEGNSFYDRQEAELRQGNGLSWVGQATAANPVSYSFTVKNYPTSFNCEAFMFLVPNPAGSENSPDWNETNCAIAYIQGGPASATLRFRYKVNEPGQQAMYSGGTETRGSYTNAPGSWDGVTPNYLESGDLGSVTNAGVLGTWTVKFTSDTNVTLISPSGNTSSFIFPAYNVGYFAEQNATGFNIYLGMQANNADAMNQAVVYSNFSVSNTATPYSENFLADTSLDTTNLWNTSVAGGPKGVLIVPDGSVDWVTWTLPDSGFGLQVSPVLNNPLAWTSPSIGPVIPLYGLRAQLVASSELPAGGTAFFNLIKRVPTQLQVLFDGETNAPNTVTGKGGTPTATSLGGNSGMINVTVNEVDSTFHIVSSGDTVSLSSSDMAITYLNDPPAYTLVNGTVTTSVYFGSTGNQTITAADTTSTNITSGTSSSINIAP